MTPNADLRAEVLRLQAIANEKIEKLKATELQNDELKLDLKESSGDADALILLSKGLYERIQGKPE